MLDSLLEEVCVALQITESHYDRAVRSYEAVGEWLGGDGSPLASYVPIIYPQGSMALQTTVRPWSDEDTYDVDLVLEMRAPAVDPMHLYGMVEARLLAHGTYAKLLQRKRRCLCLNYTEDGGTFHMDVLPARHDGVRGGTCIEVPDRSEPAYWQPSNPRGYVAWFHEQGARKLFIERAMQAPLPDNVPAQHKVVLKRAVQLLKRRRDFVFRDRCDDSPRSIVLTTLSGLHYRGETGLSGALIAILDRILTDIRATSPGRIVIVNPTNPDERFCESFKSDEQYSLFCAFVEGCRRELIALTKTTGLEKVKQNLGNLCTSAAKVVYWRCVRQMG